MNDSTRHPYCKLEEDDDLRDELFERGLPKDILLHLQNKMSRPAVDRLRNTIKTEGNMHAMSMLLDNVRSFGIVREFLMALHKVGLTDLALMIDPEYQNYLKESHSRASLPVQRNVLPTSLLYGSQAQPVDENINYIGLSYLQGGSTSHESGSFNDVEMSVANALDDSLNGVQEQHQESHMEAEDEVEEHDYWFETSTDNLDFNAPLESDKFG